LSHDVAVRVQRWSVKVMVRNMCLSIAWYLGAEAHCKWANL
jgi:hypothetical protein